MPKLDYLNFNWLATEMLVGKPTSECAIDDKCIQSTSINVGKPAVGTEARWAITASCFGLTFGILDWHRDYRSTYPPLGDANCRVMPNAMKQAGRLVNRGHKQFLHWPGRNVKMTYRRLALTCSCFVGLLAAGSAFAGSIASSQLRDIQMTLRDLNDPSAGLLVVDFSAMSFAGISTDPLGGYPFRPSPDPAAYRYVASGPAIGSLPELAVEVDQASLAGTSVATSRSLVATANAATGLVFSVTGAYGAIHQPFDSQIGPYSFTLAPNTAVTLSAWAFVQAQSDGQSVGPSYWENSHSEAQAILSFDSFDGPYRHLADMLAMDTAWNQPQTLSDMRFLTVAYGNNTDQEIHLLFDLRTSAAATAAATAVMPEPSSVLLTILGLVAAALSTFSRRRHAT
jgi:hypothetical protein